jgi:hypothetical protein
VSSHHQALGNGAPWRERGARLGLGFGLGLGLGLGFGLGLGLGFGFASGAGRGGERWSWPRYHRGVKRLFVLVVVLGLLLGGLAWGDIWVRGVAEEEARARLARAIPQAQRSEVTIVGFPFVGRILMSGAVERIVVVLHGLKERGVELERVQLEADDIVLDRDRLLGERVLAITDVGHVRVEGIITADAVTRALGVPLELRDGTARVTVEGQTFGASISVAGRAVLVTVTGAPPLAVPLPPEKYLPCQPEVTIEGDRLAVACSTTELPAAVMEVLGKGTG